MLIPNSHHRKILIIDASKETTESLSQFFNYKGIKAMSTNDAMEGLLKIRQENFDLILLDADMPVISGLGIIEFLAREGILENQSIFIFSKPDISEIELQYLLGKDGIKGVLKKPINRDDLLISIQSVMEQNSSENKIC